MDSESSISKNKTVYGVTKLHDTNYLGWSYNVKQVLKEHKALKIVTGEEIRPVKQKTEALTTEADTATAATEVVSLESQDTFDARLQSFTDRQEAAMRIISLTINDRQQQPIRRTDDPKEAWDILARLHQPKGLQRKLFLSRQLYDLRKAPSTKLDEHNSQ